MPIMETGLIISGLVALGKKVYTKAADKVADAAATTALGFWNKAKALLGLTADPPPERLEKDIGKAVYNNDQVHAQLEHLLKEESEASAAAMVGSVNIVKGSANIVGQNSGTITTTNTFS